MALTIHLHRFPMLYVKMLFASYEVTFSAAENSNWSCRATHWVVHVVLACAVLPSNVWSSEQVWGVKEYM